MAATTRRCTSSSSRLHRPLLLAHRNALKDPIARQSLELFGSRLKIGTAASDRCADHERHERPCTVRRLVGSFAEDALCSHLGPNPVARIPRTPIPGKGKGFISSWTHADASHLVLIWMVLRTLHPSRLIRPKSQHALVLRLAAAPAKRTPCLPGNGASSGRREA